MASKRVGELNIKDILSLTFPHETKEKQTKQKQIYVPFSRGLHMYIAVSRLGAKTLVYRRKMDGTTREKKLANLPDDALRTAVEDAKIHPQKDSAAAKTIRECIAKANEYEAEIQRGVNPFDEAAKEKGEPTLRDLFDQYMALHMQKNRKRVDDTAKNFDRWFAQLAGKKALSITHQQAEQLHGKIKEVRGPYAANRAVQLGRAIYNKAKLWKLYFGENPFSGISLFKEQPRERFLTADEAGKLINALQSAATVDLRDFILLDMLTGARKLNLLSMRWADVDFATGTWTIPDTKNGTRQLVPLGGNELAILEARRAAATARKDKSPFVFPGTGRSGHLMDFKRSWTTLRKGINLTDLTVHDLRRSLAATMANQNVNMALIKGAMHHKDMKTTLRSYAHTSKQAELEAKQLAHAAWFRAAGLLPDTSEDVVTPMRKKKHG